MSYGLCDQFVKINSDIKQKIKVSVGDNRQQFSEGLIRISAEGKNVPLTWEPPGMSFP